MVASDYSNRDYWKAIILYGLNNATYKISLGKTLIELASRDITHVPWNMLSGFDYSRNSISYLRG